MSSSGQETLSLQAEGLHARLLFPSEVPASLIVCIHGGGCNGRYFDLPSFSFAAAALEAGHAVLTVDRPGHGESPVVEAAAPIRHAARLVPPLIGRALFELSDDDLPVALFGHSIGGAVALHCAAQSPAMPACVVTSGIGARPTQPAMMWHDGLNRGDDVLLPQEFFFGPDGSFDWRAPIAIRKSAEPWCRADIDEVLLEWPREFEAFASRITAPALCILSEHERIWDTSETAIEAMRRNFTASRAVVEIAAGGGHLYEVHRNWSAHAGRIIAFIEEHIE